MRVSVLRAHTKLITPRASYQRNQRVGTPGRPLPSARERGVRRYTYSCIGVLVLRLRNEDRRVRSSRARVTFNSTRKREARQQGAGGRINTKAEGWEYRSRAAARRRVGARAQCMSGIVHARLPAQTVQRVEAYVSELLDYNERTKTCTRRWRTASCRFTWPIRWSSLS